MKNIILLFTILCCNLGAAAQEIEATVTVTPTRAIQIADPKIFETMKSQIQDFMNNQKWTDEVYENDERIKVTVQLTIDNESNGNTFGGKLTIQATRPVFNSNYETQLINYIDNDVSFFYEQFQPIQFSKNAFVDNLSSIFSFYSFIILGMDYDSYALNGGEQYYLSAQEVLNQVPQALGGDQANGWKQGKSNRNRFWMIENILNPRTKMLRQASYEYHRLGLDLMVDDVEKGKKNVANCVDYMQQVASNVPNSMIMQMFIYTKSDEIIEILKEADKVQKAKAFDVLTRLDASHANKYNVLNLN